MLVPTPGERRRGRHRTWRRTAYRQAGAVRVTVPADRTAGPVVEPAITSAAVPRTEGPSAVERLLAKGRVRASLAMLGPAFVAGIAYVDPGNFATNLQGGAQDGYVLMWVVLLASGMGMLVQYLSAKLGVATDHSLPELVRAHYPRPVAWGMWVQAEVMAIATDIAEFLGAAIGMNLVFGVPMLTGGVITGVIAIVLLGLQSRGHRPFELAVTALLGLIFAGFLYQTLRIGPSARDSLRGLLPTLSGGDSFYLAAGIIGATIMPHVVYLHSSLTSGRVSVVSDAERRRVLRFERVDVLVALGFAGLVNMAMLAVAARLLHTHALDGAGTILQAHEELGRVVGGGAALAFAIALLASGISSSSVGTLAGQLVMTGFVGIRIPLLLRRITTMAPAIVVIALGTNASSVIVLSQVALSFGIPFALVPLVVLTSRRDVMGVHVNRSATTAAAWAIVALICGLDVFLLYGQFSA